MSKRVLYQWVGTEHMESFSSRCVLINRVLGMKELDYEVIKAKIPTDTSYLEKEFKNLHTKWHFVVLQMLEEKISGRDEILRTLDSRYPVPQLISSNDLERAKQELYFEWAWDTLFWHCSYARWMDKENKNTLSEQILEGWNEEDRKKADGIVFPSISNFYKGRRVSEHPVSAVKEKLESMFEMLNGILEETGYFGGSKFGLSDLSIFSILLSIVSVDVRVKMLLKKNERLTQWFISIDYESQTAHTKLFKL